MNLQDLSRFARTVDARIETLCRHAPPDAVTAGFCEWEFRLKEN